MQRIKCPKCEHTLAKIDEPILHVRTNKEGIEVYATGGSYLLVCNFHYKVDGRFKRCGGRVRVNLL